MMLLVWHVAWQAGMSNSCGTVLACPTVAARCLADCLHRLFKNCNAAAAAASAAAAAAASAAAAAIASTAAAVRRSMGLLMSHWRTMRQQGWLQVVNLPVKFTGTTSCGSVWQSLSSLGLTYEAVTGDVVKVSAEPSAGQGRQQQQQQQQQLWVLGQTV
jgi:hypothetical protein